MISLTVLVRYNLCDVIKQRKQANAYNVDKVQHYVLR